MQEAKNVSHIVFASYLDISVRIEYLDFPKTFSIALHNEECLKLNSSFVFLEIC
jgi:hypothetical protein